MKRAHADAAVRAANAREGRVIASHISHLRARDAMSRTDAFTRIFPRRRPGYTRKRYVKNPSDTNHGNGNCSTDDATRGVMPSNRDIDPTWARPPVPPDVVKQTSLEMMHTDTTYTIDYTTQRPKIELHGVTRDGNSVMANVYGFDPHFSITIPDYPYIEDASGVEDASGQDEGTSGGGKTQYDAQEIVDALRRALIEKVKTDDKRFPVDSIRVIQRYKVALKEDILGYKGPNGAERFIQVWLTKPSHIAMARKLVERGFLTDRQGRRIPEAKVYEANIRYILRYMVDIGLHGGQWMTLENVKWVSHGSQRKSRAQLEVDIQWDQVKPISMDERPDVAPLTIMSFDIECITHGGEERFPDAQLDPCIQIAAHVEQHGVEGYRQYVWTTVPNPGDTVDDVIGHDQRKAIVYVFDNEVEMLCSWARFMRVCDPDIVTGYNIMNFDLPYLIDRVTTLGINAQQGLDWSRVMQYPIRARPYQFQSAQAGTKESHMVTMPGRTNFDMYQWYLNEKKMRSYGLNAVSQATIGDRKEDVPHYMIRPLYMKDAAGRARVAQYCLKDARLPMQLMQNQLSLVNYNEMVRVVGVPLCWLLERGQMAKTRSKIMRYAKVSQPHPYMMPSKVARPRKYRGAIVVSPERGYYVDPVIVLDFASLYPSIMCAFNIDYATIFWVDQAEALGLAPDDYIIPPLDWTKVVDQKTNKEIPAPNGNRRQFAFVKAHVRKGLLPQILEELLSERGRAKGQKSQAYKDGNIALSYVYDGKQLALKITANSTYGFTSGMMLPDTRIAEAVTAFGRDMITDTKRMIHTRFQAGWYDRGDCAAKNIPFEWWDRPPTYQDPDDSNTPDPRVLANVQRYEVSGKVVYGDTDSVMVLWKGGSVARALDVGKHMSDYCRQFYVKPNDLELENVYYPYLLLERKKYAALFWTRPEKYDKIQIKGLEGARRDWTRMTVDLEKDVIRTLMFDRDIEQVKALIRNACEDLLLNRMDVSKLVITKGFNKPLESYAEPYPAHIQQALRMAKRDPSTAPSVGSRIASVVIQKGKKASSGDRMEDPLYVMQNNIQLDGMHYIEKQLIPPFVRLLTPVFASSPEERNDVDRYYKKHPKQTTAYKTLFTGPHMHKRIQRVPKTLGSNSIAGFFTRTPTCVVCRLPAARTNGRDEAGKPVYSALCRSNVCRNESHATVIRYCVDMARTRKDYREARQTCVDCQGGMRYEDIMCENKACDNWYTRYKAQIDYENTLDKGARYAHDMDLDW